MRSGINACAAVLLFLAGAVNAQTPAGDMNPVRAEPDDVTGRHARAAAADGYLERIERLAPRVWVIRQGQPFHMGPIGNVTVIEQSNGLVLVDSGGSPGSGRRIARLIRSVSSKPVTAVIVTHWHGDHPFGLSAIREAWPRVRIIATERTRDAMLGASLANYPRDRPDPRFNERYLAQYRSLSQHLERSLQNPGLAREEREGLTRTLRELEIHRADVADMFVIGPTEVFQERLTLGDRTAPIEIFHPGRANTDGDAVVWLPRQRIIVTGDVVVSPVPFGFGSYPREWIRALQQVRSYEFDILVPGHGTPQRDRRYIDQLIALIEEVRNQVAPLAAQGLSLEEVRRRVDFTAQRRIFAGDDAWLGRGFQDYWITPFVEAAWKEARGIPITQGVG